MKKQPITLAEATHANWVLYTDVRPFEIVSKINDKTITVRQMETKLDPEWKPEISAGGFAGHCTNNQDQRWIYSSNEDAPVLTVRKHKDGRWYTARKGRRFSLAMRPINHYDYNF